MYPDHFRKRRFSSVLVFHPHVNGVFGHKKRRFFKKNLKVKIFADAGLSFLCGWTKSEVFNYDDVIHHRAHALYRTTCRICIALAFSCGSTETT